MNCLHVMKRPDTGGPSPLDMPEFSTTFSLAKVFMERKIARMQRQGRSLHFGAAFVGDIQRAAIYLQMPRAAQ